MPWCPVCKSEYREGILRCAECDVELVEELAEEQESIYFQQDEYQDKEQEAYKEEPVTVYENKREKAEEHKVSAYTLCFVGILGIAGLLCMELGILPFSLSASTKIMMFLVLGALFVVFLAFGIYYLKSYKGLLKESEEEESQMKEVEAYLESSLPKEEIEASLNLDEGENVQTEVLYFERIHKIETEIQKAFPLLEDGLIAKLAENHYGKLYE